MPKLKTKRTLFKRIKMTKRGKLLRRRVGKSHLLVSKSKKRKRRLRQPATVSKQETKALRRLIGF